MSWPIEPATENQTASPELPTGRLGPPPSGGARPQTAAPEPRVGKRSTVLDGKSIQVFTLSLGEETIELLPLRNWGQLDIYKWRVRGKLPDTPAGLEITPDHVKLTGEIVAPGDPEGCAKLETLFRDWLAMERQTVELAKKKAQAATASPGQSAAVAAGPQPIRFQVELDKEGLVHIHCLRGKETLATAGLSVPGFQSLVNQGVLRKPHTLKTGALHDWVELDGVLFSFEKGNNDSARLAQALNESYVPQSSLGEGQEVVIFSNAASSTGFDIQFPAKIGGVPDHRRRPLAEDALELLQDPNRCGIVQPGIVIKLTRPTLIFKQKTPDGGERYLDRSPENLVRVRNDDGEEKVIDLSLPVNYLHLSALEFTAVFNHPTVNRHGRTGPSVGAPVTLPPPEPKRGTAPPPPKFAEAGPVADFPRALSAAPPISSPQSAAHGESAAAAASAPTTKPRPSQPSAQAASPPERQSAAGDSRPVPPAPTLFPEGVSPPNLWLKPTLEQQPIRFDWFTWSVYEKMAAWAGNSREGHWQDQPCWFIRLGEVREVSDPQFRGILLLPPSGFGFLSRGYLLRFDKGTVSLGVLNAAEVRLVAVGIGSGENCVFIVSDNYRSRFGIAEPTLAAELSRLKEHGAVLHSIQETLASSSEAIEVLWTVPAEQANPTEPKAVESRRR
jgi:hypothetical protein